MKKQPSLINNQTFKLRALTEFDKLKLKSIRSLNQLKIGLPIFGDFDRQGVIADLIITQSLFSTDTTAWIVLDCADGSQSTFSIADANICNGGHNRRLYFTNKEDYLAFEALDRKNAFIDKNACNPFSSFRIQRNEKYKATVLKCEKRTDKELLAFGFKKSVWTRIGMDTYAYVDEFPTPQDAFN